MKTVLGRPKSDNPKNNNVKVRFDDKTYAKLKRHCNINNIKRTDLIRDLVINLLKDK